MLFFLGPSSSLTDTSFITLGLLTGGDPFDSQEALKPCWVTWNLAWVIRIFSWLIIPALVGFTLGEAVSYLKAEQEKTLQRLRTEFPKTLRSLAETVNPNATEEQKEELAKRLLAEISKEDQVDRDKE